MAHGGSAVGATATHRRSPAVRRCSRRGRPPVIVTPGATARLTIVAPFKPAQVVLKAKDEKTGKLFPGWARMWSGPV